MLLEQQDRLFHRYVEAVRFVPDHPDEVAMGSIIHLAMQAGVSQATVTRFAQELGLSVFPTSNKSSASGFSGSARVS